MRRCYGSGQGESEYVFHPFPLETLLLAGAGSMTKERRQDEQI